MKALRVVLSILAALAAVAGLIYVIATYGDKISAWARNLLNRCNEYCCCDEECCCEECCCEEACDEEVQADEADFEA